MSRFKQWMKTNNVSVTEIVLKTSLNEKTITKLRANNNVENFQLQTFIKLKKGYPNLNIKEIFPELKNLC